MNKEDIEFMKNLKEEMLTQDKVCQADTRFWVVMQTVKDYWVDDNIDGICIYNEDLSENVFEGDLEELTEWIKKEFDDIIEKCEYNGYNINIICKHKDEYFIDDIDSIKEFLEEYNPSRYEYSFCNYREREEIAENTMFLTLRECKEHIEANSYHYNKPHPYAMTAWRSPQVERLYKILQNTNWNESEVISIPDTINRII